MPDNISLALFTAYSPDSQFRMSKCAGVQLCWLYVHAAHQLHVPCHLSPVCGQPLQITLNWCCKTDQ